MCMCSLYSIYMYPIVGNKYITTLVAGQRSVLFLRNWIRSGIRKVGDLVFTNGILNENHINQTLVCKQNMYVEIMMMKDALRPYQQHFIELQHRDVNIPNLRKSKDFYRVYIQNPYHNANEEPVLYVEKYCENEQDLYTLAFSKQELPEANHRARRSAQGKT